jgi:hypothetical protein
MFSCLKQNENVMQQKQNYKEAKRSETKNFGSKTKQNYALLISL